MSPDSIRTGEAPSSSDFWARPSEAIIQELSQTFELSGTPLRFRDLTQGVLQQLTRLERALLEPGRPEINAAAQREFPRVASCWYASRVSLQKNGDLAEPRELQAPKAMVRLATERASITSLVSNAPHYLLSLLSGEQPRSQNRDALIKHFATERHLWNLAGFLTRSVPKEAAERQHMTLAFEIAVAGWICAPLTADERQTLLGLIDTVDAPTSKDPSSRFSADPIFPWRSALTPPPGAPELREALREALRAAAAGAVSPPVSLSSGVRPALRQARAAHADFSAAQRESDTGLGWIEEAESGRQLQASGLISPDSLPEGLSLLLPALRCWTAGGQRLVELPRGQTSSWLVLPRSDLRHELLIGALRQASWGSLLLADREWRGPAGHVACAGLQSSESAGAP